MLEDKIYNDYLTARKAQDKKKSDFLSFIRAGLKNYAIDLRKDKLDDNEAISVLRKQKKALDDSKQSIVSSGRMELLADIEGELSILNSYLPQLLSDQELESTVKAIIVEVKASTLKDMGTVIKAVLAKVGDRTESKKVSEMVKKCLGA